MEVFGRAKCTILLFSSCAMVNAPPTHVQLFVTSDPVTFALKPTLSTTKTLVLVTVLPTSRYI